VKRLSQGAVVALGAAWFVAVAAGFVALSVYKLTPGAERAAHADSDTSSSASPS
jgi:hypothetical protein